MKLSKWFVFGFSLLFLHTSSAQENSSQTPLLIIGASYSEGKTPFNNGIAPLDGLSVGFGSYLSLGHALTREKKFAGFVINEGQAGASTFARPFCAPGAPTCGPAGWDGYRTQLERALARVALPPAFTRHNAKYVVITVSNDCLHADAFGVPQSQSTPCTLAQMNESVDRLIAVGRFAVSKGITPIYDVHPRYEQLNLPLFRDLFGLHWVIDEHDYNLLRDLVRQRIQSEFPEAVVLDIWQEFVHLGDGIHPDYDTARKAAHTIARKLAELD